MDPSLPGFLVGYVLLVRPPCIQNFTTDFLQRCLSTLGSSSDQVPLLHANLHSQPPTLLLKEWAKLKLAMGPWKAALATADNVGILLLWYIYPSWA